MFKHIFREQAVSASHNRQRLDRLLRVTAPRERFALAAVGLVLAGLGCWLAFGGVVREITVEGVLMASGQPDERRLRAEARVGPSVARRLIPGMPARVEVRLADGTVRRLEGVVGAVQASPAPASFPARGQESVAWAPRVGVDLGPVPDPDLPHGAPCTVHIALGHYSPASLLLVASHG